MSWTRALPVLAIALVAGCSGLTGSPTPEPSLLTSGPPVGIETASLDADLRRLTLNYTGGAPYKVNDPCSRAYAGKAEEVAGVLEATVMDVTPFRSLPEVACALIGYGGSIKINLPVPFTGERLHDADGGIIFLRRPSELISFAVPDGWLLRAERNLQDSPTGRWESVYSPDPVPGGYPELRELDIFQAFDHGDVSVGVAGPVTSIKIGDTTGTVSGPDDQGELGLTFTYDGDQVCLVGNIADFTPDELAALAASASRD